jgi:hypothetical protein
MMTCLNIVVVKPNDKQNWCFKIKEILFKHGLNYMYVCMVESMC